MEKGRATFFQNLVNVIRSSLYFILIINDFLFKWSHIFVKPCSPFSSVFSAVTLSGDNQDTQMAFAIMKGRRILQNLCVHSEPS